MTPSQTKAPAVGLVTAVSIAIANMVGTGVFTSLAYQADGIKSGFALLFLWVVGGAFALCGALVYGELGAAMPRSGGEYHLLSKIYHPAIGFLSGWLSVTVGFAAPIALAAMALGQYANDVAPFLSPQWMAIAAVIIISLIHARNLKWGSYFQDSFTFVKVLSIVALIVCGLLLADPQGIAVTPQISGETNNVAPIASAAFATSLVFVTYAYSGWNASVYLVGELERPEKTLPRSLILATAIVMVLYLGVNFVFLRAVPFEAIESLSWEEKPKIAALASEYIFGPFGGKIMSSIIAFGLISTISSMVWAGPRVTQTMGEDIPFFRIFARKNNSGVPYLAIWFQLALVLVAILTSTFESITTYLGFTLTLSSLITVLGVFVHRWRYPDAPRPYKTWGYPFTPLIFAAISLWILIFVFRDRPWESLAGLGTIGLGYFAYLLASRSQASPGESKGEP